MIVEALHEGMVVDRTEALGERDLFRGRQRLVAEEHHEVLEPSGFDLGKRRLVDAPQIHAADFSAKRAAYEL
jgi:hypothetical protein